MVNYSLPLNFYLALSLAIFLSSHLWFSTCVFMAQNSVFHGKNGIGCRKSSCICFMGKLSYSVLTTKNDSFLRKIQWLSGFLTKEKAQHFLIQTFIFVSVTLKPSGYLDISIKKKNLKINSPWSFITHGPLIFSRIYGSNGGLFQVKEIMLTWHTVLLPSILTFCVDTFTS